MSIPQRTRKARPKRGVTKPVDGIGIIRNIAIACNAVVYLTYPALTLFVNIFMPEIIDPKTRFDPVSDWAKMLTILGATPAAIFLSIAVLVEANWKLKNERGVILTLIAIGGTVFSLAALFIGLLVVFVLSLALGRLT